MQNKTNPSPKQLNHCINTGMGKEHICTPQPAKQQGEKKTAAPRTRTKAEDYWYSAIPPPLPRPPPLPPALCCPKSVETQLKNEFSPFAGNLRRARRLQAGSTALEGTSGTGPLLPPLEPTCRPSRSTLRSSFFFHYIYFFFSSKRRFNSLPESSTYLRPAKSRGSCF